MDSNNFCQVHEDSPYTFICIHNNCHKPVCDSCIIEHCQEHEKKKTFPKIQNTKEFKRDILNKITSALQELYNEAETINLGTAEMVLKKIHQIHEYVKKVVDKFFKAKEEEAKRLLKDVRDIDTGHLEKIKYILQDKIVEFENIHKKIAVEDIYYAAEISKRNFMEEVSFVQDQISKERNSIEAWRSPSLEEDMIKFLISNIGLGKKCIFSILKKADDLEVTSGFPVTITKPNGTDSSIALGEAIKSGHFKMSVRIDRVQGAWLGIGFIENPELNLKGTYYSQAVCITSDGYFFNLTVNNNSPPIAQGVIYHFEANLNNGEILIQGENGLNAKTTGFMNRVLYPYFEFRGIHQATIIAIDRS